MPKIVHVLPGDAAAMQLKESSVSGEFVICRECLVDGDVGGADLETFWKNRAAFIGQAYSESADEYDRKVRSEFERLVSLASDADEINLWFEHELFCQVNLWFTLSLLRDTAVKLYRVASPDSPETDLWRGFGGLTGPEMEECLHQRVEISAEDRAQAEKLWDAYRAGDHDELLKLSHYESAALRFLDRVCVAETQKETEPAHVLREILNSGKTDFGEVFGEFRSRLGVYGFGDSQVRRILSEI